jgi:toxin HigB-1
MDHAEEFFPEIRIPCIVQPVRALRATRRRPSTPFANVKRAAMRLIQLNGAARIEDLRLPPSNRLEALAHDRAGQWSIRINDQWRVCFRFENGDAYDVEIVDYH